MSQLYYSAKIMSSSKLSLVSLMIETAVWYDATDRDEIYSLPRTPSTGATVTVAFPFTTSFYNKQVQLSIRLVIIASYLASYI